MDLFTLSAVVGALAIIFILFSKWRYQYWARRGVAQLNPQLIFGDIKSLATESQSNQDFFFNIYKKCKAEGWGKVGIYSFFTPELMVCDLKLLKNIYIKDFEYFSDHGFYHHQKEPITEHLFNMEGEEWKKLRVKLTPTFTSEVVKETIKYREQNDVQRKDFMQLMLQLKNQSPKGSSLTEQEIIAQSFVFYLAGFETSSTTATFALLELAHDQDVQKKLRQEINNVLEKHGGQVTYDALMEMEYLDKVVHETLRKYPPVATIPRQCTKRYKVPDSDLIIEKGTRIYIPAWGIQKDPEYYPNPEEFNPENFSKENKSKRPELTWMPFGEGPRVCIGLRFGMMQSKISIISLLREFRFSHHEQTKWPLEMEASSPILSVKGQVWLKVERL